jgi:hypothetical protein
MLVVQRKKVVLELVSYFPHFLLYSLLSYQVKNPNELSLAE